MAFFIRELGSSTPETRQSFESSRERESRGHHGYSANDTDSEISGVWGSKGHVFVARDGGRSLSVMDSFPWSRWTRCEGATRAQEDQSPVVSVIANPSNTTQAYVIHNNSTTVCLEHAPSINQWNTKHQFQLSNAKGAQILSVSLHPDSSMFFWCEKRSATPGLSSCCVCMREVQEQWTEETELYIGPVVAVLHSCPVIDIYMMHKGVCMVPRIPGEDGRLLLFWTFVPRTLKAYIWGNGVICDLEKSDFRSIMMEILPAWHSNSQENPEHLLTHTSHPTTLELLLIDSSMCVSITVILNGQPVVRPLCTLSMMDDLNSRHVCHSFAIDLYLGIIWDSGLVNVYDVKSGVVLCNIDDLTGIEMNTWISFGTMPRIGFWSSKGIWQLVSKSIIEVSGTIQASVPSNSQEQGVSNSKSNDSAETSTEGTSSCSSCSSNVVFEVPTEEIASRMCKCELEDIKFNRKTSEELDFTHCCDCRHKRSLCNLKDLFSTLLHQTTVFATHNEQFSGPLTAVRFLETWKLDPHAAKIALDTAISQEILGDNSAIRNELLELLFGESFQSPVLAIALLWNNPVHRTSVNKKLQEFLTKIESMELDNEVIKTALNEMLLSELKHFHMLNEKFEALLKSDAPSSESSMITPKSIGEQAMELLKRVDPGSPDNSILAQLELLESHNYAEVLESVAKFSGLGGKMDTQGSAYSQRWRKIFRLEWKDGQWRKNHRVQEEHHNSFLGLICHLVYSAEPDWLMDVKGRGLAVVSAPETDEQAENFVTQSVLDCLPVLRVDPSPKSTHAHATLLWTAGQELQAMQVMLRHKMWLQAVEFYSLRVKDSESPVVLYTMLLKGLLRSGVPTRVLFKALNLAPKGLSTYEMLAILRENGNKCFEPFVFNASVPTVGDVRAHLEKFLSP